MRNSAKTSAARATYLERVNRAIDHVVAHLDEPLRLRDLARAALLSPFHFHRVFQSLVGETPAEFVKRLRLEKALTRMAHARPRSFTALALDCGFSSSSDFSRCFKQRFGTSPRAFDLDAWRAARGAELRAVVDQAAPRTDLRGASRRVDRLPPRHNADAFRVRIRNLPPRTVAYICVDRPYRGDAVVRAAERLVAWADRRGLADGQWLGYQWDNPEVTALDDCRYYVAVEAERFTPCGEIGRFEFPPMTVAEVAVRGDLALELRALHWLYGVWLPRSGYVPDDHPGFEAWIGKPFAHGTGHFEIHVHLPVRRMSAAWRSDRRAT
ncbi:MAG: GyrI-like domain-containing protein [Phycisphaerae bacterium]